MFDDGTGPALYVGGYNSLFQGTSIHTSIARWNGHSWSVPGPGISVGNITAMCAFDDGSGPRLYVAGNFDVIEGVTVNGMAKWDGHAWSAVDPNIIASYVNAFIVHDDGSGPSLYMAGLVGLPNSQWLYSVLRLNGNTWSLVEPSLSGSVTHLAVVEENHGPVLYAGGQSVATSTQSGSFRLARWDGTSWHCFGNAASEVAAMATWDDGRGPALYVAGSWATIDGVETGKVARWDGETWSSVGPVPQSSPVGVYDLHAFRDKNGSRLYAAGISYGFPPGGVHTFLEWNGVEWKGAGRANDFGIRLTSFDDGSGPALYAAGGFDIIDSRKTSCVARRKDGGWSGLGNGTGGIHDMAQFDPGTGASLFIGGSLYHTGVMDVNGIAQWLGYAWSDVGGGVTLFGDFPGYLYSLTVFDDGTGPALYVGGWFDQAGGAPASNIAKWDGHAWSPVGGGTDGIVTRLHVHDDGSAPALYVTGQFDQVGDISANRIARWDGKCWSTLGDGLTGGGPSGGAFPTSMTTYDDGDGPALIVAGEFAMAGGSPAQNIARWKDGAWTAMGAGISGDNGVGVYSMTPFGPGDNKELYIGGYFTQAGNAQAIGIARWDGKEWHAVDGGVNGYVLELHVLEASEAPTLLVAGTFDYAGDTPVSHIAQWDGLNWTAFDGGVSGGEAPGVYAVEEIPEQFGRAIYFGGSFTHVNGLESLCIGKYEVRQGEIAILDHPSSQTLPYGDLLQISVTVEDESNLNFQWRRNGTPLTDDDRVSGSQTSTLIIQPVDLPDTGRYEVVVTAPCGMTVSNPALISVQCFMGRPTGDMNRDGLRNGIDVQAFTDAARHHSQRAEDVCFADFNYDGAITFLDVPMFVELLLAE